MSTIRKLLTSVIISSGLISHSVLATDWTEKVTIRGFASAVYQKTDDPVFFNGDCTRTFALNMMGNTKAGKNFAQ